MSLMTATYTAIGRELWGQQAIGEATEVQKESIKSKRRVSTFVFLLTTVSMADAKSTPFYFLRPTYMLPHASFG